MIFAVVLLVFALVMAGGGLAWYLRRREVHRLVLPYLSQCGKFGKPAAGAEVHLLLCIADHFEPRAGHVSPEKARTRVQRWVQEYPRQFGNFGDSDGRPPRHTFFFPIDEYEPEAVEGLAELCRAGFGELEIHLHHDQDTAEQLRQRLLNFRDIFSGRHGLLARQRNSGEPAYGFIHGNWALCNSRPDGRLCGVNEELDVLRQTGCYADFTMPSAPHPTQSRKINSIYYALNCPGQQRSHDRGVDVGKGPPPADALMLIQGPLVLDWSRRKWGLLPRLENGCLQKTQPPDIQRLGSWLKARVQVPSRPDWFFVKLHAHGALEQSQEVLLGEAMVRFHQELAGLARENPRFHYHYLTARELYNLVKAAEAGWKDNVAAARDYQLLWNGTDAPQGNLRAEPPPR